MDYFGALVDDLTEMMEEIEEFHPQDGERVLRSLRRLMVAAVETERMRVRREAEASPAADADPADVAKAA